MTADQRTEVTARIGPIRQTLEPDHRAGCLLISTAVGLIPVGICVLSAFAMRVPGEAMSGGVLLLGLSLSALIVLVLFAIRNFFPAPAPDCLLIGVRGLAEVRQDGLTFLLWDDLGVTWRAIPLAFDRLASIDPIVLLLEHEDGRRFRLRVYPGIRSVRTLIGQYLRRNTLPRPQLTRTAEADDRVTSERPMPGILGPWTGSDVDRFIGPIRLVCPPHPDTVERLRRRVRLPFTAGLVFSTVLLLGSVAGCVAASTGVTQVPFAAAVALFFVALASFAAAFSYRAHWLDLVRTYLLLGEQGVAIWSPGEAWLVLWDDLGTNWRADSNITARDRETAGLDILLKLRHADGPCFYITDLYENARRVVARVIQELHRPRPLVQLRRGPPSKAIRAPAHFSETPPVPSVLPVPVVASEEARPGIGTVDFVCAAPQPPGYVAGGLLLGLLGLLSIFGGQFFCYGLVPWALLALMALLVQLGSDLPVRWLVGTEGIALQGEDQFEILRWADLGTGWRVFFLDRMVILLADGTELTVPPAYAGAARLEARVRDELARRVAER